MSYARGLGIETLAERAARVAAATPDQRANARRWYDEALAQFNAGNYDGAIRLFTDTWNLVPEPAVLIAIGWTMVRLGRFQEASLRFQRYLQENPTGSLRSMAQSYLAQAQAAMEQQARTAATAAPPVPPEVPPEVMAAKRAEQLTPLQIQQQAPNPSTLPDPYARRTTVGVWIATGAGIVGLIGLGVWAVKRRK